MPYDDSIPVSEALSYEILEFEGHRIPCAIGVQAQEYHVYIPIVSVCSVLGIDSEGQIERIRRHRTLRGGLARVEFDMPYGEKGATRRQPIMSISWVVFHTWLTTIEVDQLANAEARERLAVTQAELAFVLYSYVTRWMMAPDKRAELEAGLPAEARDFHDAMAQVRLLREQQAAQKLDLEAAKGEIRDRLDEVGRRVDGIEARIGGRDTAFIDGPQQRQFVKMVEVLGDTLKKKGRGDIPTVHNELKDQFGFASYKLIPADQFEPIVAYCAQWYRKLAPPGTPLPDAFTQGQQKRLF